VSPGKLAQRKYVHTTNEHIYQCPYVAETRKVKRMSVLFLDGKLVLPAKFVNTFPGDHSVVNRWKGSKPDLVRISNSSNIFVMKLMKPVRCEPRHKTPNRISIWNSQNDDPARLQPSVEVVKNAIRVGNVFEHIGVVDNVKAVWLEFYVSEVSNNGFMKVIELGPS